MIIREALAIVSMQGNQVLNGLTTNQYEVIIKLLECAILSTDLGLYFKYVMLLGFSDISIFIPASTLTVLTDMFTAVSLYMS